MENGTLVVKCGLVNQCLHSVTITTMGIGIVFTFGNFILAAIAKEKIRMTKIIDGPLELIKKNNYELDDILNDPKYNLPNFRELVRRCLKELKEYMEYSKYLSEQNEKLKKIILDGNSWNEDVVKMQRRLKDI
jgi:hypothetical protein